MCILISPENHAVIDLYTATQAVFIEKIEKQGIEAAQAQQLLQFF